jgi:hypothetical protein
MEKANAESNQEDHELKADPAHPSTVQGSDGGRAQSEATKEN